MLDLIFLGKTTKAMSHETKLSETWRSEGGRAAFPSKMIGNTLQTSHTKMYANLAWILVMESDRQARVAD